MTTATTYTDLINLYAHHLTGLRDELMNSAQFPLTAARNSLIAINNVVELACHDAGKNWGPILSEGVNIKAASRAKFIQRITEALEGLEGLKAALIKYSGEDARQEDARIASQAEVEQVSTCFARGSDVLETSGVHVALPVCTATNTASTYLESLNKFQAELQDAHGDLSRIMYALQTEQAYTLTTARKDLTFAQNMVQESCDHHRVNWGPILEAITFKASSRALFIAACHAALLKLDQMERGIMERKAEEQAFIDAQAKKSESAFINRAVAALDSTGMGEHNVYVFWFRIAYGCWLDAEEVVNAGGRDVSASHRLADYLEESLGLSAADVRELMAQDWDFQDAEGLAARCICNHGGFDWLKLEELLEVDVEPAVLVAGLACGLEPDAIEDAYMGEWDSDEDMAAELWEQGGMLDGVPDAVRSYIDWELVARDMLLGSDVVEANGHYFRAA